MKKRKNRAYAIKKYLLQSYKKMYQSCKLIINIFKFPKKKRFFQFKVNSPHFSYINQKSLASPYPSAKETRSAKRLEASEDTLGPRCTHTATDNARNEGAHELALTRRRSFHYAHILALLYLPTIAHTSKICALL